MGVTTVLSVRVPKDIIEKLKEKGLEPNDIVKKALKEAHRKLLLEKIYQDAKKMKKITKRELLRAIEEGRA